jgi:hypothetical protein
MICRRSSRVDEMVSKSGNIDGQNVLYHYIQKNTLRDEDEFSKELIKRLIFDLSIWIPINFFCRLPIILPYVVRDPSCRVKRDNGEDEWGACNSAGFLRDDNSLIKGIVRSFHVRSHTISAYDGLRLGKGFVACHIWGNVRVANRSLISSRHYMLNSFVPNLVWLPVQISKLTDREGSLAQRLLQAISHRIYERIPMPSDISLLWKNLPYPEELEDLDVNPAKMNYFAVPDEWMKNRVKNLVSEMDDILSTKEVDQAELPKIKSRRFLPTLKQTPIEQRLELNEWLTRYKNLLKRLEETLSSRPGRG